MSFLVFVFNLCWVLSMLGFFIFLGLEYFESSHYFRKEKIDFYEECSDLSLALAWLFFFLVIVTGFNIK